ncbi:hypothetical protein BP5796_12510 [Coleophoma crateriformis]|uniref:Zn(2)-C6 fungal-type domain-containing protein n=1 Tax=Coleophoma crateriformis TaxID=565419 RepID=A0A3D8Q7C9_9HELO|nr:hypothetical protein BP5796_12510 [Coleophoma crateriformis]
MSHSQRQQTGLACEDCRRRKARCDRARPSCGSCQDSAISCRYVDKRPKRGPRKGEMMGLKNLIADLEQRLNERTIQQQPGHEPVPSDNVQKPDSISDTLLLLEQDAALTEIVPIILSNDLESSNLSSTGYENCGLGISSLGITSLDSPSLGNTTSPDQTSFTSSHFVGADMCSLRALDGSHGVMISDQNSISDWLDGDSILSPSATPSGNQQLFDSKAIQALGGPTLSELMQADLILAITRDELYFERVHPVLPNIHRRKYFTWARQKRQSVGQVALQYAMRAVAAAVSAQYQPLSTMLCAESRRLLERMNSDGTGDGDDTHIEQIQAWLLVAHWELLCNHEHQAMLAVGRAIRMVQLARLHDVDAWNVPFVPVGAEMTRLSSSPVSDEESFVKAEEQRRTFWLAYCFDRFCFIHSECPPSLQDESIRTRLPASEMNFQNDQPVQMDFLCEVLAHNDWAALPSFARCVVLHSLFSRCISHQRFAMSEAATSGSVSSKVWSKYAWLTLAVEKRKEWLLQSLPNATDIVEDPMVTLAAVLAACAATNVYHSMAQSAAWTSVDHEDSVHPNYTEQAIQAASELVRFIESMPRSINCFKAHPFLPTLIYRAALFLIGLSKASLPTTTTYSNQDCDLVILFGALRDLEQVNKLSGNLLQKLEKARHEGSDVQEQRRLRGQENL